MSARLPRPVPAASLRAHLRATLTALGLTGLTLDRRAGCYHYGGGPADCELAVVPGGTSPEAALATEVGRQLNTPFPTSGVFSPFRFFFLDAPGHPSLGVAYFHAMAGAESVVLLVRDIVHACGLDAERGLTPPVELHPQACRGWLVRHPGVLLRKLLELPALGRALRRACRPGCRDPQDHTNGFVAFTLPPATLRRLSAAARAWGVTLNDLFLAGLLRGLAPLSEEQRKESSRRHLAVGCIVNTRSHLGVDSRRTFGLFLGSFLVFHSVPAGVPLRALATDIQRQTGRIKRDRRFMAAPVDMTLARLCLRALAPERRARFFPKHYPLWGGVTNMNLNPVWPQSDPGPGVDYLRAVSTGPATPLVLSLTTVRNVVNVGLTFRTAVFDPAAIATLQTGFLTALQEAAG
jgi:hypothetical protein